jgi:outer membrane protein OmpA-like peptidoglycan-associated protein
MGAEINSKYDEETIEISSDGRTLYYSSRGHYTTGGFDIFKATKNDDGTWNKPENIGYPVNTPDDDMFFMLSPNQRFGYFSADRPEGFGDKDIYRVIFLGPERPVNITSSTSTELIAYKQKPVNESEIEKPVNIVTIQLSIVKGIVTDAYSGKPIEASIELVDNATGKVVKTVNSYPGTGAYTVTLPPGKDYALTAGAPDYFFYSENLVIADTSTHEVIRKDIQLQPMGIGAKIVLNNVFFDSGKATLKPESYPELDRLVNIMKQYPNLKIEISGHTDSKGSDVYNQKLSQQRSQSVSDYIISQGVNLAQITAYGYGETIPRADNLTEAGRGLNRRVEAKILEK